MDDRLREALRIGRCGPLERRLARAAMRTGLPGRQLVAFGVLGKPRGGPVELTVERGGIRYALDLRDDSHRLMFLGIYESDLIHRALGLVPEGGHVVDVGANVGFWTLPAAVRVGSEGSVTSFEPNPWARGKLLENIALNRARRSLASTSSARRSARHAPRPSWPRRISKPRRRRQPCTAAPADEQALDSVEVEVVALDDVVSPPVDLLKIDVEGHELAVLDGATQLFATSPPSSLVVEVHGENLARAGSSPEALVSRIESLGYVPVASDGDVRAAASNGRCAPTSSRRSSGAQSRLVVQHAHVAPRLDEPART